MKRDPSARAYNWTTLFLGDINIGSCPFRSAESRIRQQNMVMSSEGLGPESDWQGPEAIVRVNYRPDLSSEKTPHMNKTVTIK
jgi:hypothetical protein